MHPARARLAYAAAVLAAAGCAAAKPRPPPPRPRPPARSAFDVPGHGTLELAVPPGWTARLDEGDPSAPRTIRLGAPGADFVAYLAPFWNPGEPEDPAARADGAQLLAELARRGALAGSVEREIPLEELVGDGVHGFWFAATDRELAGKEPAAGEYRHLLQGAAAVGPLVVAFTLLDNGPGPQRAALLALVRGARYVAGAAALGGEKGGEDADGAADADGGPEPDPGVATLPLRVEVRGRPWTVLVDLPGFRMFKPRSSDEGVEALVVGHDPDRGIVASVMLRPADRARDAGGCRDEDLARIRAAHPALAGLRLSGAAGAARAAYTLPQLDGKPIPQLHGHAWLWRDDVCASVHVSKAAPGQGDAAALERILDSVRYGADL
jgi:hypothetical protein